MEPRVFPPRQFYAYFRDFHKLISEILQYRSTNVLQPLQNCDEITNGTVIEVVVSSRNERPEHPHVVNVHSYLSPTFCDYCGEILVGLAKQGLKCSKCHRNFHKKCAFAARNNCADNRSPAMTNGAGQASPGASSSHNNGFGLPHTFVVHSYCRKSKMSKSYSFSFTFSRKNLN